MLGLTFDKPVAGLVPENDRWIFIIKDELADVTLYGQDGVPFVITIPNNGQQQRSWRPPCIDEYPSLQEGIVLAVAVPVRRVGPFLNCAQ